MQRVQSYALADDFIGRLGDFIQEKYLSGAKDLSRLAVVFGGRRPALFLKHELSRRIRTSYFPPQFFSMDEWMEYITGHRQGNDLILTKRKDARKGAA